MPLYLDVYLFNWTNPEDIKDPSTKPIFQQIGPYRFRDYPDKHNITFHSDNSTVSYKKSNLYYFEPDMSNGTMNDKITTVNILGISAASTARNWKPFKQFGISTTLSTLGHKLYVEKTIQEILFEGYTDPLVSLGTLFSSETDIDRVGFMVRKNASDYFSGKYTVHTGVDNIYDLGKIKKYNDKSSFPFQKNECRKLKGSPGEFYPPERNVKEIVDLFTPEMCRSLPYEYHSDKKIHGIKGNRYNLGLRALDNGTLYKENKCYYKEDMPSGVINMTDCAFDQPFYISFPHFYLADSSYVDAVEGLSPQKELHESYMTLDEKLSITLETVARFQTNIMLDQYGSIVLTKNVPKILMPLFFVEQKFLMDEDHARELYYGLLIFSLSKYSGFVLIFLGIIFIICRSMRCCHKKEVEKDPPEICSLVVKEDTLQCSKN